MICLKRSKKQIITMGRRNIELGLLLSLLLLLVLLHLETSACFAEGHIGKSGRVFRRRAGSTSSGGSSSSDTVLSSNSHELSHVKSQAGFRGNNPIEDHDHHKDIDGDEVFGAEKRKVYTGPNPLHNR